MTERGIVVTSIVLTDEVRVTMGELCRVCGVSAEYVITLVDEGLLEPEGRESAEWRFSGTALPRVRTVLRLQRDLNINLPGVALALDLFEETQRLRTRVRALERLLGE